MICKHEVQHLVGSSDGILCKNCGRKFVDFKEIEDDLKSLNLTANTEKDGGAEEIIEKPKKTAVPAQDSTIKGLKDTGKKAVSTSGKTQKTRKSKKGAE